MILTFVIQQTERKADVTKIDGKRIFAIVSDMIRSGEKDLMKERTHIMSKVFKEARFPIPKKDNIM